MEHPPFEYEHPTRYNEDVLSVPVQNQPGTGPSETTIPSHANDPMPSGSLVMISPYGAEIAGIMDNHVTDQSDATVSDQRDKTADEAHNSGKLHCSFL